MSLRLNYKALGKTCEGMSESVITSLNTTETNMDAFHVQHVDLCNEHLTEQN